MLVPPPVYLFADITPPTDLRFPIGAHVRLRAVGEEDPRVEEVWVRVTEHLQDFVHRGVVAQGGQQFRELSLGWTVHFRPHHVQRLQERPGTALQA